MVEPLHQIDLSSRIWVCINCWEVILGEDTKAEHVNARHFLTNSMAETPPYTTLTFIKMCRIYGKINPEETHCVLFYIPQYVRDGLREGYSELPHRVEGRERREI